MTQPVGPHASGAGNGTHENGMGIPLRANCGKGAAVARADLLRVLGSCNSGRAGRVNSLPGVEWAESDKLDGLAELDELDELAELAQGLGFYKCAKAPTVSMVISAPAVTDERAPAPVLAPEPAPRAPLRIPFFGVLACLPQDQTVAESPPASTAPQALRAADFAPCHQPTPPFQPLLRPARLVARLQVALQQQHGSHLLDLPRVVNSLARQHAPARWPRRTQAWPPARVLLLFDHSLSTRVAWPDQEQVLISLAHWLGPRALACYHVPGDPWQPASAWVNGQRQIGPILSAPAAGTVVLLLTGPSPRLARWQQVAQFLAQNGATVWWFDPFDGTPRAQPAAIRGTEPTAWDLLLTLLSCARRIEPELLRALRLLHPALAQAPHLEAQVWASPLFEVGYDVAVWRADQHAGYRNRFASLPHDLQQQVWHTLRRYHASRGRAIFVQEALAFAAHADVAAMDVAMAAEVKAARAWLAGLLQCEEAHAGHAGFAAFAGEWFAFHAEDEILVRAHEAAFAKLWAIADAAAVAHGRAGANSLCLSPAQVAQASHLASLPKAHYHLCQTGAEWGLRRADTLPGAARPGMPLELAWIMVDGQRVPTHVQRQVPLTNLTQLGQLPPGDSVRLHTPAVQLRLGPVAAPWAGERGRDKYGLYALWNVAGQVIRLRYIEPGQFWMGSPDDEHGRDRDEGPRHLVTISHGFWLADTACSQALWQAVMGDNPSHFNEKNGGGPSHPVESMSFDEICQFLEKLSALLPEEADFQVTLPTEAEWEYACRAGTASPFWFGEDIHTGQANFDGREPYRAGKKGGYREKTVPVNSFSPNGWGLYQMHGNVWEWCGDVWREYEVAPVVDPGLVAVLSPQGDQESRPERAIRGGRWGSTARGARSAYRDHLWRDGRRIDLGFRLALRSRRGSAGA